MVGMPTIDQHWPNVVMMLALCPQHWPDVGAGGHWYVGPTSHQWLADGWPNIGPSSAQHWHVYGVEGVGLKLKPSKCEFLQNELLFLGHVVGREGITPNPKLTESVKNWNVPRNAKEVQQFLGLVNYYGQHIYISLVI